MIQREIQYWQSAGQDGEDNYRGLYISDREANQLINRPLANSWGQTVSLPDDVKDHFSDEISTIEAEINSFRSSNQADFNSLRLNKLVSLFNLDQFDLDIFLICMAPSIDLKYERIYGYLQDDVTRKQPGINLILNLLAPPGLKRFEVLSRLNENAPLMKHHLIEKPSDTNILPILRQSLYVNETVFRWLFGNYQPQADFAAFINLSSAAAGEVDHLLFSFVESDLHPEQYDKPHYIFSGADEGFQIGVAYTIAEKMDKPLISVDCGGIIRNDLPIDKVINLVFRDALLLDAIPLLTGWDACLDNELTPQENLLVKVCEFPSTLIVSSRTEWHVRQVKRKSGVIYHRFKPLDYTQSTALWKFYLQLDDAEFDLNADKHASQYELTSSQIRDSYLTAKDAAYKEGRGVTIDDVFSAARMHSNTHLSNLARKVTTRYDWSDIVLPDDQIEILHEIVDTFRGRSLVLGEWGVGEKLVASSGIPILFSGPPGTGKTMAAEIIAGELGLDLYKIDLSSIVSKYIGETEKNMERIFTDAESSNAILFFDEADALFGKRSEVRDSHDRYANIEISYLLQRMEIYDGVTILATNLKANLDEAFTRRLQFSVNFPFPDENDRLKIWKTLFPPKVPLASDIDWKFLAIRFRLAGGNIRNIIVNAAFLASADGGQVTMNHLLHSTQREYQKLGRLIGEEDFLRS